MHWVHHYKPERWCEEKTMEWDDKVQESFNDPVFVPSFWQLLGRYSTSTKKGRKAYPGKFWKKIVMFFCFPQTKKVTIRVCLYIHAFIYKANLMVTFVSFRLQGAYKLVSWMSLPELWFSFFFRLRVMCLRVQDRDGVLMCDELEYPGLCTRAHTSAVSPSFSLPHSKVRHQCNRVRARAEGEITGNKLESSLNVKVSHSHTFVA